MEMREWLSIIVIIAIVLILLDGVRRKVRDRNALRVKLDKRMPPASEDDEDLSPELPNGGARTVRRRGPTRRRGPAATQTAYTSPEKNDDMPFGEDEPEYSDPVDESRRRRQEQGGAPHYEAHLGEAGPDEDYPDDEYGPGAADQGRYDEYEYDDPDEAEAAAAPRHAEAPYDRDYDEDYAQDDLDHDDDYDLVYAEDRAEPDEELDTPQTPPRGRAAVAQRDDGERIEPSFGDDDFSDDELADERLSALRDEDEAPPERPRKRLRDSFRKRGGRPPAEEDAGDTGGEGADSEGKDRRKGGMRARLQGWSRDHQGELPFSEDDEAAEQAEEGGEDDAPGEVEEVIIINVMSRPGEVLHGQDMLPVLMRQGLRLGDMSIFHRHADAGGNGPVLFSMANMVKPGTFDMSEMDEFTTPGVSLFMQLPGPFDHMQSFEKMLETARALKDALGGELKDENRSVLTRQTIEHYRERIRDFELRQLARK